MSRGGAREGAGRKRTSTDGELRKMRSLRASEAEWELIKKFAAMVKGDIDQAMRMIETK